MMKRMKGQLRLSLARRYQVRGLRLMVAVLVVLGVFPAFGFRPTDLRQQVVLEPLRYAGWAMEAYPKDTLATLKSEMSRQAAAGANVVWLGHNNPGDVG